MNLVFTTYLSLYAADKLYNQDMGEIFKENCHMKSWRNKRKKRIHRSKCARWEFIRKSSEIH